MKKATDLVLESELKDNKDLVKFMTDDAITFKLQGHHNDDLNKDYTALCSSSLLNQTSEYLFGDLSKLAKDITGANQVTKKCLPLSPTG